MFRINCSDLDKLPIWILVMTGEFRLESFHLHSTINQIKSLLKTEYQALNKLVLHCLWGTCGIVGCALQHPQEPLGASWWGPCWDYAIFEICNIYSITSKIFQDCSEVFSSSSAYRHWDDDRKEHQTYSEYSEVQIYSRKMQENYKGV